MLSQSSSLTLADRGALVLGGEGISKAIPVGEMTATASGMIREIDG
jgi:hypothetical protein